MPTKPSLPPIALTPAAELLRADFLDKVQRSLKEMGHKPLTVLVWGADPSKATWTPDTPEDANAQQLAAKRLEIRAKLAEEGHNPMLSEEIVAGLGTTGATFDLPVRTHELAQVRNADYIVILMGPQAPGTTGEVHDFGPLQEVAVKMFVLCPKSYEPGYTGDFLNVMNNAVHNVHWYEPQELTDCDVLTLALERVRSQMFFLISTRSTN